MELCLPCIQKVIKYREQRKLYKKQLIEKPRRYTLCKTCEQYLDIESYLYKHRSFISQETGMERQEVNCISPCGYGMWASKSWKENVIDKRRS